MLKRSLLIIAVFLSTLPMAKADHSPNEELRKLRNVINNSIPEKYRGQLNGQLNKLESSIEDSCTDSDNGGGGRDNGAPVCNIEFSNTYSKLTREGQVISDWSSDLNRALEKLSAMQDANLCSLRMQQKTCKIEFSNTYSKLVIGDQVYKDWSSDMSIAVDALKRLRQLGICE